MLRFVFTVLYLSSLAHVSQAYDPPALHIHVMVIVIRLKGEHDIMGIMGRQHFCGAGL